MERLGQVHLLRVGSARKVVPGLLEKADRVDDQRVAFPVGARVAVEGGLQIFRMIGPIDEELAIHVRVALEEHQHEFGCRKERGVIGSRSRRTTGQTACFKIFRALIGSAIRDDLRGPRQHVGCVRAACASAKSIPDAREVGMSVRQTRHRAGWPLWSSTAPTGVAPALRRSGALILRCSRRSGEGENRRRDDEQHYELVPHVQSPVLPSLIDSVRRHRLTILQRLSGHRAASRSGRLPVVEPSFALEPSTVT